MNNEALRAIARSLAADLALRRPVVVLDLETTSKNVRSARIVALGLAKILPLGRCQAGSRRLNPGVPIAPGATAVHGLSNEDVAAEPTFADIAQELARFLDGCDLAGYGIRRFDFPILQAEFARLGMEFSRRDRHIIDALSIYHHYHPRDLGAAVRLYAEREIEDAHDAGGDVRSTLLVLRGQLDRHDDLPRDVEELARYGRDPGAFDEDALLVWYGDRLYINFGKYDGHALEEAVASDPDYFDWMLSGAFSAEVKAAIRQTRGGLAPGYAPRGAPRPVGGR